MIFQISHHSKIIDAQIDLPYSKSISNRALIIQAICQNSFKISQLSKSTDSQELLTALNQKDNHIKIGDGGTTIRFLTAYLATTNGTFYLSGSPRLNQRPIKDLVDALTDLGANIQYLKNDGFPPLKIIGKKLKGGEVSIQADISSQFISALLLIAPTLKEGLVINLKGQVLSRPYIQMTLDLMHYFGIQNSYHSNCIIIKPQQYLAKDLKVEADWSALAFLLECMVLSKNAKLRVNGLWQNSWQGDIKVLELFQALGIKSKFINNQLELIKTSIPTQNNFDLNLKDYPDLAQAYICTLSGLSKTATIEGLENLKYKESHRLKALQEELSKIGQKCKFSQSDFRLLMSQIKRPQERFDPHNDHRMAMCLAPLALINDVSMNEPYVVEKSYPTYWDDLKKLGFTISVLTD